MLWKYKKCYQETNEDATSPCNNRYLTSVSAAPNSLEVGCSSISVSFMLSGWVIGDDPQLYNWTISNTGEVFTINSCIDLDTLIYNCVSRITFVWDDEINCCI